MSKIVDFLKNWAFSFDGEFDGDVEMGKSRYTEYWKKYQKKINKPDSKPDSVSRSSKEDESVISPLQYYTSQPVQPNQPNQQTQPIKPIRIWPYKPIKQVKLIVILIENSEMVSQEEEMIKKIVNNQVAGENNNSLFCLISYDKAVHVSKVYEAKQLKEVKLIDKENVSEGLCLYDALLEARKIALKRYYKTKEEIPQEFRINSVELIGIGRCIDNCSKSSKEEGINAFGQILFAKSTTKYFAIDDSYFLNPAEIGFRSIGAIRRNFF